MAVFAALLRRLAVPLALLAAGPAFADQPAGPQLGSAWTANHGTDADGNAYCSLTNQSADQSYGLLLIIYPLGDDPSFELHLFKDGWAIAGDADVATHFSFSDGSVWDADGQAESDGSAVVDYSFDLADMKDFLTDFAQSSTMDVQFAQDAQAPWHVKLNGTATAALGLLHCADKILQQNDGVAPPDDAPPASPPPEGQVNL